MRGGKIVHPLAHRPIITQRFRPARRAGAAIRGPGQPRNAPAQDAEKTPDQPDSSQPRAGAPGLEVSLRELTQRCLLQLHDNLLRRVLRELPHGHPFCPATSSQDYSEQPSQNKRSEKPRPLHKTQTPPRRIVEAVFNAQDAVAADVAAGSYRVACAAPCWTCWSDSPTMSHVISMSTFQALKLRRCNCPAGGCTACAIVGRYDSL